jgi:hypothetical protein
MRTVQHVGGNKSTKRVMGVRMCNACQRHGGTCENWRINGNEEMVGQKAVQETTQLSLRSIILGIDIPGEPSVTMGSSSLEHLWWSVDEDVAGDCSASASCLQTECLSGKRDSSTISGSFECKGAGRFLQGRKKREVKSKLHTGLDLQRVLGIFRCSLLGQINSTIYLSVTMVRIT